MARRSGTVCINAGACKEYLPNLSKPQAAALAAFRFGVAKAKSRPISAVARGVTFLGIPDTVGTRLRRFISNPRIDMAGSCENLARSVIRAPPRKKPVILLVDETSLQDRLKAMVVSVACEGRAIPVAMMTYHQTRLPMGQVEMTATTLMGQGRSGQRQGPDREGGQGHRDFAEPAQGDRRSWDALHDARVQNRPCDDGRRNSVPVRAFDGGAGEVLESEGEGV